MMCQICTYIEIAQVLQDMMVLHAYSEKNHIHTTFVPRHTVCISIFTIFAYTGSLSKNKLEYLFSLYIKRNAYMYVSIYMCVCV